MTSAHQQNDANNAPAIPSIDLNAFLNGTEDQQQNIAIRVNEICRSIGFLIIDNHGVPTAVVENAWSIAREFFDLPLDKKLTSKSDKPGCPRGYFPMESEALARSLGVDTPPDIKESFGIGPLRAPLQELTDEDFEFHYGANLWPCEPADLREALTTYFNAMEALGSQVLRLFAVALQLPRDYFEQFHTHPMSALRCINYPYSEQTLLPNQKGAGEHSDYGSITILKPDPKVAGLEIKLSSGLWAKAPLINDGFIINIGDMMSRWTNDRWVSTLHRVVNPGMERGTSRRQALAFFHNTNYDAEIKCLATCIGADEPSKFPPVLAGQYLLERFRSAVS